MFAASDGLGMVISRGFEWDKKVVERKKEINWKSRGLDNGGPRVRLVIFFTTGTMCYIFKTCGWT